MSKTLVSVLEVAAVVAVQAIPGVGQFVGAAFGVSAGVGTAIATAAVTAAEYGINSALAPAAAKPEQTEMAMKPDRAPPRCLWLDPLAPDEDDDEDGWTMITGFSAMRRNAQRNDDLYDADDLGLAFV